MEKGKKELERVNKEKVKMCVEDIVGKRGKKERKNWSSRGRGATKDENKEWKQRDKKICWKKKDERKKMWRRVGRIEGKRKWKKMIKGFWKKERKILQKDKQTKRSERRELSGKNDRNKRKQKITIKKMKKEWLKKKNKKERERIKTVTKAERKKELNWVQREWKNKKMENLRETSMIQDVKFMFIYLFFFKK